MIFAMRGNVVEHKASLNHGDSRRDMSFDLAKTLAKH